MKLYNTYSKKLEEFKPLKKNEVLMYNCGPTVYGFASIGNFATFLTNDFLKRYLKYQGYHVKQIMNITDVGHLTSDADEGEDKIIKSAKKEGKSPKEIASFFEKKFFEDLEKLNIDRADHFPRATDHIKEMIELITILLEKGYAYEKNGNVYFNIEKFKKYGKLSGNTIEKLKQEVRSEVVKDKNKNNPFDFVLWFKAPKNHLMKWSSPWNEGYPGWHLECSAMCQKYLGKTIDLHTGGEDNIFPHHEAEIAQSEAANNKKFVNYWLHRRHILVDGKKMSKSKGNIFTVSDLEKKGFDPLIYRFFIFGTHYRSKAHFSFDNLAAAKKGLERIVSFIKELQQINNSKGTNLEAMALDEKLKAEFESAMDQDLNTPKALSAIYDFITKANRFKKQDKINKEEAQKMLNTLMEIDSVLGVVFLYLKNKKKTVSPEIKELLKMREMARNEKDFSRSDEIRKEIEKKGFTLKDTMEGQEIFPK